MGSDEIGKETQGGQNIRAEESTSDAARPRRRRRRAERRAEIAEATLRLMARHGLQGATVTRIAEELGVAPQSLYAHFKNRDEMLFAAIDPLIDMTDRWIESSNEADIPERLRALGRTHMPFLSGQLEGFVIPSYEFLTAPRDTGLPEAFGRRQAEELEKLARIIDEGKKQGSIREDLDSLRAAWRVIVVMWAEDVAEMMGLREFIGEGISEEILDVLLRDMARDDTGAEH